MKFKELMENVDYDDLSKLRSDLLSGGKHIKNLVAKRMEELEQDAKICAVCGKPIIVGDDSFTLIFGRDDFKKRASFCAIDCLDYFLTHVKKKYKKTEIAEQKGHSDDSELAP